MAGAKEKGRTRLSAVERKRQMVDAADHIVNRDRSADLSMREVADRAGASRALAYAYFPDRIGLLDALLEGQVDLLVDAGIVEAAARGSVTERACAVAAIYLRHVAAHGEALALVLRDAAVARQLNGAASRLRGRVYRALGRSVREALKMSGAEAMALIHMLVVIPEEAARQMRMGILTVAQAQALSDARAGARDDSGGEAHRGAAILEDLAVHAADVRVHVGEARVRR